MTHSTLNLKCRCGTVFEENIRVPIKADALCAQLLAVRCPQCEGDGAGLSVIKRDENPGGLRI